MVDNVKARQLLDRWFVNIKKEDKRHSNMPSLFDALAEELILQGVAADVAHQTMREASKKLYPSSELVKNFYKKSFKNKTQSLFEFTKEWHTSLDNAALKAFFDFYPVEGEDLSKENVVEKIQRPDALAKKKKVDNDVDAINNKVFWDSVKIVSKENPWLFDHDDDDGGESTNG